MNLLQMYCSLLMADMAEYYKTQDPEGWESMQAMIRELKAAAEGEPVGDLAMRALAGIFPLAGPAVAMESAMGAPAGAGTRGEAAGSAVQTGEHPGPDDLSALPCGERPDDPAHAAGPQSAILIALARLVTGANPKDGSTAEESLDKAIAAAGPISSIANELLKAAAAAAAVGSGTGPGIAETPATVAASPEADGNAEQAVTELTGTARRILSAGSLLLRMAGRDGHGQPGKPGLPGGQGATGGPGATGKPGAMGGQGASEAQAMSGEDGLSGTPGLSGNPGPDIPGATDFEAVETAETGGLWQGFARSVWQYWQTQAEEEERAAASGAAGFPKDEEFRVPGQLSSETMAYIAHGRETLALMETTPLSAASGAAAAGAPSLGGDRTALIETGSVAINTASDKDTMNKIATEVTTAILKREIRASIDQFDDGVWA